MKPILHYSLLILLATILFGCPYDSPYAIDEEPVQNIDESLLGKWAAFVPRPSDDKHYKEDPVKIIFEKRTNMEYDIAITGYLDELRPYKVVTNDTIIHDGYIGINDAVFSNLYMMTNERIWINKTVFSNHSTVTDC